MCSFDGNADLEMVKVEEKTIKESDICRKCQTNQPEIILRAKDFYCRSCFLIYFIHKFRSTIGKSKEIKPGDKVLIAFSGGQSSTALLHLIQQGLNDDSPKKIKFEPSILYINESILNPEVPFSIIYSEVQKINFPFYHTSLKEVFKNEESEITIWQENYLSDTDNSHLEDKLNEIFSKSLKSQTSREDMLYQLRNELICRCAQQLGFTKVFLGTSGTRLSIQILTDIALGRGSQLGDHVQFKSQQFGVELFRPMRELFEDEIKHFIECQTISIPDEQFHQNNLDRSPSIASCTKDFLLGLQREFVSTVPTVFKTGGKFTCGTSHSSGAAGGVSREGFCLLCGLGRDASDKATSAAKSIEVSKILSAGRKLDAEGLVSRDGGAGIQSEPIDRLRTREIFKGFCYGCANLYDELENIDNFPPRVKAKLKEKATLGLIQDCLL